MISRWIFMSSIALGAAVLGSSTFAQAAEHHSIADKEKHVSLDKIPKPARETILREAGGAKIENVEVETRNGATVYEAHVRSGDNVTGIVVSADGKLLDKHDETNEKE